MMDDTSIIVLEPGETMSAVANRIGRRLVDRGGLAQWATAEAERATGVSFRGLWTGTRPFAKLPEREREAYDLYCALMLKARRVLLLSDSIRHEVYELENE